MEFYTYVFDPHSQIDPWGWNSIQIDPSTINFSQSWVSPNDYATVMKQQGWIGDPLRVIERNGNLVSFDNRRLAAAQEIGLTKIPVTIVNGESSYPASSTGKTWNDAFNERLKRNGLGANGTAETPAIGKKLGQERINKNRGNNVGCS